MSCGSSLVKILLFIANGLFTLAGLGLIIVGALSLKNIHKYDDAIPEDYQNLGLAPILTITIGSVIFLIAFLGCCGAVTDNTCMLSTYSVILLVLLLLQIALGVYAFIKIKNEDDLRKSITKSLENLYHSNKEQDKQLIKLIEEELDCCGAGSYTLSSLFTGTTCLNSKQKCDVAFYNFLHDSIKVIGITLISLVATEVIGTVFALCLASSIRNEKRRSPYA